MPRKSDAEILDELETKPDRVSRHKIRCEVCGTKNHVRLALVSDENGDKTHKHLCPNCRYKKPRKVR